MIRSELDNNMELLMFILISNLQLYKRTPGLWLIYLKKTASFACTCILRRYPMDPEEYGLFLKLAELSLLTLVTKKVANRFNEISFVSYLRIK